MGQPTFILLLLTVASGCVQGSAPKHTSPTHTQQEQFQLGRSLWHQDRMAAGDPARGTAPQTPMGRSLLGANNTSAQGTAGSSSCPHKAEQTPPVKPDQPPTKQPAPTPAFTPNKPTPSPHPSGEHLAPGVGPTKPSGDIQQGRGSSTPAPSPPPSPPGGNSGGDVSTQGSSHATPPAGASTTPPASPQALTAPGPAADANIAPGSSNRLRSQAVAGQLGRFESCVWEGAEGKVPKPHGAFVGSYQCCNGAFIKGGCGAPDPSD